jgi:hypothetical protein
MPHVRSCAPRTLDPSGRRLTITYSFLPTRSPSAQKMEPTAWTFRLGLFPIRLGDGIPVVGCSRIAMLLRLNRPVAGTGYSAICSTRVC